MKNPFSRNQDGDHSGPMTNKRLDQLIKEVGFGVAGQLGFWQFTMRDRDVYVITDESHNRMRIMTQVVPKEVLDQEQLTILLEANFDRALDAKFAISDDWLWSVFTHPLGELTDPQFLDCLDQVTTLAENFGSSYASSELFFGGG